MSSFAVNQAAALAGPATEADLEERLSRPTDGVARALDACPGDVIVLGAGGKMGPTLATMLRRATGEDTDARRVIAVSRFSSDSAAARLEREGIDVVRADLFERDALARLPDAPNVVYMAGQKFGTTDLPSRTWAVNTVVPALVAERFASARIVAFSTGNVYSLTPVGRGGSREDDALTPLGEYANSCVGRERVLEHFSHTHGTPTAIVRLNYAVDLRYGVVVDIARKVRAGDAIDLRMGYVNVIWQGDANAQAIQCLAQAASPPFVVNVTGPEVLSVRSLAESFGARFGRAPRFVGKEAPDALLSDTSRARSLFGPPTVTADMLVAWVGDWLERGGPLLDKPTHFETRDGSY